VIEEPCSKENGFGDQISNYRAERNSQNRPEILKSAQFLSNFSDLVHQWSLKKSG